MKSKFPLFILLLLSNSLGYGYDVDTHKDISENAVLASNLSTRLPDLGFTALTDKLPNKVNESGGKILLCLEGSSNEQSILDLIKLGAFCEDATFGGANVARYTNHFYDPVHNGAGYLGTFTSSLDWGLETTSMLTQDFSYKDARDYLYKGLTLPAKSDRDTNLAMTIRTLGHVMHLIEDLAQPQHTRNDSHGKVSLYEGYTDRPDIRNALPFGGYNPVQVTSPDQFWHTADGKGLADYSNRGFVSAGTNFRGSSDNILPATNYLLPNGTGAAVVKKQITDPYLLGPVGPTQPLSGEMQFISTPVQDNYSGAPADTNSRTSTFSLFDSDLSAIGADMVFSLNQFNFKEAHKLLIPRAVAYSAGLINYFFRGKMEISLPDEGVYGILDHAVENQKDTSGFRKIKLKLKNVTPSGTGIEPMAATGKLVAVAKFHRNTCYQPDLSGEYGSPGMDWRTCRSKDEDIVVSTEIAVPNGINDTAQSLMFTFPKPIPINASDVYLQVVYRGSLGTETDAVVVVTKDISEPIYQVSFQTSEQYYYDLIYGRLQKNYGHYTWGEAFCDLAYPTIPYGPECKYQFRRTAYNRFAPPQQFDPSNPIATFNATVTNPDIPVSSYARIAILTDVNTPLFGYGLLQDSEGTISGEGSSYGANLVPAVWGGDVAHPIQLDPATNQMALEQYALARGIYIQANISTALTSGDIVGPPLLSPLAPLPSIISSQFLVQ